MLTQNPISDVSLISSRPVGSQIYDNIIRPVNLQNLSTFHVSSVVLSDISYTPEYSTVHKKWKQAAHVILICGLLDVFVLIAEAVQLRAR